MAEQSSKGERRVQRLAAFAAAALLGGLLGIVGVSVPWVLRQRQRLPELQPQDFHQAKERWEAHGPASYNLEVVVSGQHVGTYRIEVRDGEVTSATRDGAPLSQRRTMGTWSVPGMLATIESDLQHVERHAQGTADAQTPQLLLRGAFDAHDGHPLRYHRTELRRWSPNMEVMWEVTRFDAVSS